MTIENIEIILPIVLLGLAFILKLSINRNVNAPNIIHALCELPVDIVFLALSFLIAYTISKDDNLPVGLVYSFVSIFIAVIVVILWRVCLFYFTTTKYKIFVIILLINGFLSSFTLIESTSLLLNEKKGKIKYQREQKASNSDSMTSNS